VPKRSAGLLLYRLAPASKTGVRRARGIEVLLVHPGGPYWARRDDGWWSIPKGEIAEGEDDLAAAEREFAEELGVPVPAGPRWALGDVVQAAGKHVRAWAVEGDVDVSSLEGDTFELEWPPRSGTLRTFPEVDRAGWFTLDEARVKLLQGQLPLLDRLTEVLACERD
jgi:predicted NUDIX family NTP pyrophosphohydrolase